MGPRDWLETIKAAVEKIGSSGDTGGGQTEGTVFAKENAILEILENGGMPIVKSVQRGVAIFNSTKNVAVTISPVDITKSVLLYGGAILEGSNANHYPDYWDAQIQLKNSTTIIAVKDYRANGLVTSVAWQVVEFY